MVMVGVAVAARKRRSEAFGIMCSLRHPLVSCRYRCQVDS